jgi:SPOR domain
MAVRINPSQKEKNQDFGLPQDEFKPIESEGARWFRITAIIVGLILSVGAGVVYWFFYRVPSVDSSVETQPMHEERKNKIPEANVDFKDHDVPAAPQATQKNSPASKPVKELDTWVVAGKKDAKALNRLHADNPKRGTITKITAPQGYYYVVVGSFVDSDLASDYASRLARQGVDVTLIAPPQGQYFFRVAVEQRSTFHDTSKKVAALKAKYGTDIWIVKY